MSRESHIIFFIHEGAANRDIRSVRVLDRVDTYHRGESRNRVSI